MCGGQEIWIQSFDGELEGKRSLLRLNSRWQNNIKLGLKEIGWNGVEWIRLSQYRDKGLNLSDSSNGTSRSLTFRECLD
jgi:hypothetical protein